MGDVAYIRERSVSQLDKSLVRPAYAVERYKISKERAYEVFKLIGFRNGGQGHMFAHKDTLENFFRSPWLYENIDRTKANARPPVRPQKKGRRL